MLPVILAALALQSAPESAIDSIVRSGITRGIYPGAVVVVGTRDRILLARGYGHFSWNAGSAVPSPDSTLFDLASLTKVVATTPAAMVLVGRGQLDLEAPVQRYLPEFRGRGKEQVLVRHLLEHTSGLRSFIDMPRLTRDPAEARRIVLEDSLRRAPGTRVEYSDLNAILLGWVIERVTGQSLDAFVRSDVHEPLGMMSTLYRPPRALRPRIMPVGFWRGTVIQGELHDQNAVLLGGVTGHAGLYSTGMDLARYAQAILNGGVSGQRRVFREPVVDLFTDRGRGNRALGWEARDTTSIDNTGALLTPAAVGHGGFTGTSIWIDPQLDVFIIVLTNRVFAPRVNRSITLLKDVRAGVTDHAVRLAGLPCVAVVEVRRAVC